ncbi:radical SAM protein [archaeon]|nr:radical SAM protein [archaeon]
MKISEVKVKSIITKSRIPGVDYVINPYTGCAHGCKYCYATFMKRFTNHPEPWGSFVDVKINAPELMKGLIKLKGKSVTLSSVTDPYQLLEKKYKITRQILEKLITVQPNLSILTKSSLIMRDLDLLKQFKHLEVWFSLSITDKSVRKELEPRASSIADRIKALKELHEAGIRTVVFIAPIHLRSDWKGVIRMTKDYVDKYVFDRLNYHETSIDWLKIRQEINDYCDDNNLKHFIIF